MEIPPELVIHLSAKLSGVASFPVTASLFFAHFAEEKSRGSW